MRNLPLHLPSVFEQIKIVQTLDILMQSEQQAKEAAEMAFAWALEHPDIYYNQPALNEQFTFKDVPQWDSVAHLSLISELEDAFDVIPPGRKGR